MTNGGGQKRERHREIKTERQRDRETERQRDRETERQTVMYRGIKRLKDRQIDRET